MYMTICFHCAGRFIKNFVKNFAKSIGKTVLLNTTRVDLFWTNIFLIIDMFKKLYLKIFNKYNLIFQYFIYETLIFAFDTICKRRRSRSSPPKVLLGKGFLKICSKFTGEHPCQSTISIKLQSNSDKVAKQLYWNCTPVISPVNLLHIFRTPFPKNTP